QLSPFTTLSLTAAFAQGGTAFLQSQKRAELGNPEVRAPGNPSMLSGSLAQSLAWEVARQWNLIESLRGNASAQQNDLTQQCSTGDGSLALERVWVRDTAGAELRTGVSWLRPIAKGARPYKA